MNILYIHMVGAFGGASRSLSEVVSALPKNIKPHFLTPQGSVEPFFKKYGEILTTKTMARFDHTAYSSYRGWRWLIALREIIAMPATYYAMKRAYQKWPDMDIIHINEFIGLFQLYLAHYFYPKARKIVHIRSVVEQKKSLRTKFVHFMLRNYADAIIAIDETVRRSLPQDLKIDIIHNAFTPHLSKTPNEAFIKRVKSIRQNTLKIGFVGNLLKVKGIADLIEAANIIQQKGYHVDYMIIGDNARAQKGLKSKLLKKIGLEQNIRIEIETAIKRYNLSNNVHLFGFMKEIANAYPYMDVLCFPSHFNAPGRPVFEAAFAKVPSIVGLTHPTKDTLINGITGIAFPPHNVTALANAIEHFAKEADLSTKMGNEAFKLAQKNFTVQTNADKLFSLYERLLTTPRESLL